MESCHLYSISRFRKRLRPVVLVEREYFIYVKFSYEDSKSYSAPLLFEAKNLKNKNRAASTTLDQTNAPSSSMSAECSVCSIHMSISVVLCWSGIFLSFRQRSQS